MYDDDRYPLSVLLLVILSCFLHLFVFSIICDALLYIFFSHFPLFFAFLLFLLSLSLFVRLLTNTVLASTLVSCSSPSLLPFHLSLYSSSSTIYPPLFLLLNLTNQKEQIFQLEFFEKIHLNSFFQSLFYPSWLDSYLGSLFIVVSLSPSFSRSTLIPSVIYSFVVFFFLLSIFVRRFLISICYFSPFFSLYNSVYSSLLFRLPIFLISYFFSLIVFLLNPSLFFSFV